MIQFLMLHLSTEIILYDRSNVPSMGPAGAEPSPGIDAAWQEAAGIAFKQDGLLDLSGRSSEVSSYA